MALNAATSVQNPAVDYRHSNCDRRKLPRGDQKRRIISIRGLSFADRDRWGSEMSFNLNSDPNSESELEKGPSSLCSLVSTE